MRAQPHIVGLITFRLCAQSPTNLLMLGQYIPDDQLDLGSATAVELQPGEATLHAFSCVHASGTWQLNTEICNEVMRMVVECDVTLARQGRIRTWRGGG